MTDDDKKDKSSVSYVSLIEDPFGLRDLEIAAAQKSSDELVLEEAAEPELELDSLELSPDRGELDQLAKAIAEEQEKFAAAAADALAEWTPDDAVDQASRLAAQIAEDRELSKELAQAQRGQEDADQDPELQAALPRNLDVAEVQSCLEALLFMVDKPLSLEKLQEMVGTEFPPSVFQEAITALVDRYKGTMHGIEIAQVADGYQFRTKPGRAALAKRLAKVQTQRLSSGAMETLAIVAYRQPVLKEDIDRIRGVDSSYFVRQLLDRKLLEITGRSELPGRPMLYGTTDEFLTLFGLKDLSALPSLREIEQMIPVSQSGDPEDEDPRVREMRRLVGQMKSDTSTSLVYDPQEDEKILKEIRERVNQIPTSTPYLEEQKELEKQAAKAAAAEASGAGTETDVAVGETPEPLISPK